ncbi:MAG TPA: sigma-70 family RNA polymerase sigma factor [Candidatus Limnocylindrales bacterium]|nr:sigma-70 family RNA polymerase sigma factor [Candidatus Limnocylindrales bacterium]
MSASPASSQSAAETSERLAAVFESERARLWAIAYRMTGCAADADDIVQETFAKALAASATLAVEAWRGWLTRVAVNDAIDVLRRRRRRGYPGAWLPSPIESAAALADSESAGPEQRYSLVESLSFAFLLALEALSPKQRAVLLLREVFDHPAASVAAMLGMTEGNVRITHLRARRLLDGYERERTTSHVRERTQQALGELLRGLLAQDAAAVEALLARDARALTDAGGEFNALARPMLGADRVARLLLRVAARRAPGSVVELRELNGEPALVIVYARTERRQAPRAVLRCELDGGGRIRAVHVVLATRKLRHVPFPPGGESATPRKAAGSV